LPFSAAYSGLCGQALDLYGKAHAGKNIDLHGSAPDKHKSALLLIDVINDLDFDRHQ